MDDIRKPDGIIVVGELPSTPQLLVDQSFVRELEAAENFVELLLIEKPEDQQRSAGLLNELTKAGSKLEQARAQLKAPFIDYGRKIDAAASAVGNRIDRVKSGLRSKMTAFQLRQEEIAREAERKRIAELRKLEEQRLAEQRERDRLAKEEADRIKAAAPKIAQVDFDLPPDEPTPVEQKIAQVQAAPAIVAPKPIGVRYDISLKFEVENVAQLPDEYVTKSANLPKIRGLTAGYREGQPLPIVPGVRFFVDKSFRGTGR